MASINKLSIRGVRSFSPDDAEQVSRVGLVVAVVVVCARLWLWEYGSINRSLLTDSPIYILLKCRSWNFTFRAPLSLVPTDVESKLKVSNKTVIVPSRELRASCDPVELQLSPQDDRR
jgi:hypothetical protein